MPRTPHGSIAVISVRGRLKLRFPRDWFGGNQIELALRLTDNVDNRLVANERARDIQIEYNKGLFDWSLDRYKAVPHQVIGTHKITLAELWAHYCTYKSHRLKPNTIHYWVNGIGRWIDICPIQEIDRALDIRGWLLESTTTDMTRRILQAIGTAVDWGLQQNLVSIDRNPYKGMGKDIAVNNDITPPNALSVAEQEALIQAFSASERYSRYTDLVKFWFMTGCRPSEGIGLDWAQINEPCTKIRFDRAIVKVAGKLIYSHKSKTNRVRTFPCKQALSDLLLERKAISSHGLVFLSARGQAIDYNNFCNRVWAEVAPPVIGRYSTPYSCRDTFITHQLAAGKPISIVAKWVDNSPQIIQSRYLDISAIEDLYPD